MEMITLGTEFRTPCVPLCTALSTILLDVGSLCQFYLRLSINGLSEGVKNLIFFAFYATSHSSLFINLGGADLCFLICPTRRVITPVFGYSLSPNAI
jgi:hypothetical protein